MRARMGLRYSGTCYVHREILLKDKPQAMLDKSPKGTVPVLVMPDGQVIDESYDVLVWALEQNDPENWLDQKDLSDELIKQNDGSFKSALDKYKYASRHPEHPAAHYRGQGEEFLSLLDSKLSDSAFLLGDSITLADIGVFPFVRQFAFVDREWFWNSPYKQLIRWLDHHLQSDLFQKVMEKYPVWTPSDQPLILPETLT